MLAAMEMRAGLLRAGAFLLSICGLLAACSKRSDPSAATTAKAETPPASAAAGQAKPGVTVVLAPNQAIPKASRA